MNIFNRTIPNYEDHSPNRPIFRKLTWKEWFLRLLRKPFIQTEINTNGIIVISADNPTPSLRRTKRKMVGKPRYSW